MTFRMPRWLRREPATHGRHVRVMPATTVPGAAPALVATAAQAVIAIESAQREPAATLVVDTAAGEHVEVAAAAEPVPEHVSEPADELAHEPADELADDVVARAEDVVAQAAADAPEPVLRRVEQPVAVEPPPFEPPPWDLPAPAAPPAPAADPVPSASGTRYEPSPVALGFSDGARFELDQDDPRVASFVAAAAAVTGAAHDGA